MRKFWKFLLRKSLSPDSLLGMSVAVFGLGDSGYQKYNTMAKKLAARVEQLGATPLLERGLGDDQARCGYYSALEPWLQRLWGALDAAFPPPPGVSQLPPDSQGAGQLDPPRLKVTLLGSGAKPPALSPPPSSQVAQEGGSGPASEEQRGAVLGGRGGAAARRQRGVRHPGAAPAGGRVPGGAGLCAAAAQRAPHRARPLPGRAAPRAGHNAAEAKLCDVLAIAPVAAPADVAQFLARCQLDGEATVRVEPRSMPDGGAPPRAECRLADLVAGALDIAGGSPRRYFFEVASHFAAAEHEAERLEYFASPEGAEDLYTYNQKEHRSVLEVLDDFPSLQLPLEWLLQLVPALQPRRFSIASSHAAHPGRAHLTVAVVDYHTPYKRHKLGLCSSHLASLDPTQGPVSLPVWLEPGSLRMPPSLAAPLILVGPGTGVAPFRSFLQEREAHLLAGEAVAPCMLFFGCRNACADYFYKEEFERFAANGVLMGGVGLQTAFSRDQPAKRYVQHCIRERASEVWALLQVPGSAIYVAGSAQKMPEDVAAAFRSVAESAGSMTPAEAEMWLRRLELSKRYNVETWS
eukprot:jgi/Tetstr1/447621/TSEL_034982.t1